MTGLTNGWSKRPTAKTMPVPPKPKTKLTVAPSHQALWKVIPITASKDSTKAVLPAKTTGNQTSDTAMRYRLEDGTLDKHVVVLTHVEGSTLVEKRHKYILDGRFSAPTMLSRIEFQNHHCALVSFQVRPIGNERWVDVFSRQVITTTPHADCPTMHAPYTINLREPQDSMPDDVWNREDQEISAFRLIAEQPSPNWQSIGVRSVRCFRLAKVQSSKPIHENTNEGLFEKNGHVLKQSMPNAALTSNLLDSLLNVAQLANKVHAALNQPIPTWEMGMDDYALNYLCSAKEYDRTSAWKSARPFSSSATRGQAQADRNPPRPATACARHPSPPCPNTSMQHQEPKVSRPPSRVTNLFTERLEKFSIHHHDDDEDIRIGSPTGQKHDDDMQVLDLDAGIDKTMS